METKELIYLLEQMLKIDLKNKVLSDGKNIKVFLGHGKKLAIGVKKQN